MNAADAARGSTAVTDEVLAAYERDGAAVVRGVLPAAWITRMQAAVDRVIASPGPHGHTLPEPETGATFSHALFVWRHDPDFRALALDSPLPALAATLLRTEGLRLFFDQLLVKEPGLAKVIEWHQDLQTFPVTGEQVLSIWVPFDRAGPENGVVTYARGSHQWNTLYLDRNYPDATGTPVPDPDTFEQLRWTVELGDVIVHHPLTLHGSPGNTSSTRRRALSIRYAGDDVRFLRKEPNFMTRMGIPLPELADGVPLDGDLFPVLPVSTRST